MRRDDANCLIRAVRHVNGTRRCQHGHVLRVDELSLARDTVVGARTTVACQRTDIACERIVMAKQTIRDSSQCGQCGAVVATHVGTVRSNGANTVIIFVGHHDFKALAQLRRRQGGALGSNDLAQTNANMQSGTHIKCQCKEKW